ncbi:MAG: sel1 repeat family protein [Lachnospiraceae bacterium]|nr:sel1 repeat family protein [Lachnospiraceae bacterium]
MTREHLLSALSMAMSMGRTLGRELREKPLGEDEYVIKIPEGKLSNKLYYHLANIYRELDNYEMACGCYAEMILHENNVYFNKQRNAEGNFYIGWCFANGKVMNQNFEYASYFYEESANLGNAGAMNNLGILYKNGHGVEKNIIRAKQLWEQAVQLGNVYAMDNLGLLYQNGNSVRVPKNLEKAKELFQRASQAGNANAKNHLADCLKAIELRDEAIKKEKQILEEKKKAEQAKKQQDCYYLDCFFLGRAGENFDHYPSVDECPTWDNPYDPWR